MASSGLVSSALLEKIDKLFACNAGEYVDLPQLVVVGDQSSGKSSVLEGLTKLPFPRDSGLCTCFATHITFRRSKNTQITASIIPAKSSPKDRQEKLRVWRSKPLESLDEESFREIMTQVRIVMEIGLDTALSSKRSFFEDVLRLEVSGPNQEHFSVIDVPGIFKRTTQDGPGLHVQSRSVMLVVIPCNVDIATQEILERAEDLDPEGIRTLGVLTKPDLIDHGSEGAVMDLVEGRKHRLRLGWHLLRNPGQSDLNEGRSREAIEENFFIKTSPWKDIEKSKVGVDSLRNRLQAVLEDHIRREFPKVRSDISRRLKSTVSELKGLGPRRQSREEQLQYVIDVAIKFQEIVSSALQAGHGRAKLLGLNPALRLANQAINRGEAFSNAIASHGHIYHFQSDDSEDSGHASIQNGLSKLSMRSSHELDARTVHDHPDIEEITLDGIQVPAPSDDDVIGWIDSLHRSSRGFELGTFDATILGVTLKELAANWTSLALGYISDIIALVHGFIVEVLDSIAPSRRVSEGIKSLLLDSLTNMYRCAIEHTNLLLRIELDGTPATYNHHFNKILQKRRNQRLRASLDPKSLFDCDHGLVVRLDDVLQGHPLSNSTLTTLEIHDILCAYYEVARDRFVDAVRMQVADHMLVNGKETPLTLFSAKLVASLSHDALEDIAGEEMQTKSERLRLEREISLLGEGKMIIG